MDCETGDPVTDAVDEVIVTASMMMVPQDQRAVDLEGCLGRQRPRVVSAIRGCGVEVGNLTPCCTRKYEAAAAAAAAPPQQQRASLTWWAEL
eukprot:SAG25_NODE_9227_length_382_cov_0.530035_1_plen_91_part_10